MQEQARITMQDIAGQHDVLISRTYGMYNSNKKVYVAADRNCAYIGEARTLEEMDGIITDWRRKQRDIARRRGRE